NVSGLPANQILSRVWAVVIPPLSNLQQSEKPILDFPTVEMAWSETNGWEGEFENLSLMGEYRFMIYYMDNQGRTSVPIQETANVGSSDQRKAVIVVGGNADPENQDWLEYKANAELAYQTLKWQGYQDENIEIMSPGTLESNVTANVNPPSAGGFQAILALLGDGAKDLVLYMTGPGKFERFVLNDSEEISAADVSGWLGSLETLIVYDADFSGSFIKGLSNPANPNRIIVASTSGNQETHSFSSGNISFSNSFWHQIFNGENVWDAYLDAKNAIQFATGYKQV
ncbi:unnamed protein product, partial [marine sediment metagenome]